jgi:hypothetical protein
VINTVTGEISFDDLKISHSVSLSEIHVIFNTGSTWSMGGRTQLSLGVHFVEGVRWGVGVIFANSKLSQVWLQLLDAPGVDSSAWSLDNELQRKVAHDQVVCTMRAGAATTRSSSTLECKFNWGKVSSVLDARGVQALLVIEYY